MLTRMRLVKGATALLYVGPLIAGLGGFGWTMTLPFTAIFVQPKPPSPAIRGPT